MLEFARQEIRLTSGELEGLAYDPDVAPVQKLWFNVIDSGQFKRHFLTAGQQMGKSLCGFVIPTNYRLLEKRERVILGIPDRDLAADKWNDDLMPMIKAGRYADELPTRGKGSKGGTAMLINFARGGQLRIMTGGGGDGSRSGKSAPNVHITEADKFDTVGGTSKEADKFSQLEGRSRAYPQNKCLIAEGTPGHADSRTWQEIQTGTDSRVYVKCPDCLTWVYVDREHLVGWKDAPSKLAAGRQTRVVCPGCGCLWDDEKRRLAVNECRLVHKGQSVDQEGHVVGDVPETDTFGMRWHAIHHLPLPLAEIGMEEWAAEKAKDRELAEQKVKQFLWGLPHDPEGSDQDKLTEELILSRVSDLDRMVVPENAIALTVGIDQGKFSHHWVALAGLDDGSVHVCGYGQVQVQTRRLGAERAVQDAVRTIHREVIAPGFAPHRAELEPVLVDEALVDSGDYTAETYEVVKELVDTAKSLRPSNDWPYTQYLASKGFGFEKYRHPQAKSSKVRQIGNDYYLSRQKEARVDLVVFNSDAWKDDLRERLLTAANTPGALSIHRADGPKGHMEFAQHLTSESPQIKLDARNHPVRKWIKERARPNHYLDAAVLALIGLHRRGCHTLLLSPQHPPPPRHRRSNPGKSVKTQWNR